MAQFICTKRRQETGMNWCVESRRYTYYPTFWSRFSFVRYFIELDNFGEFYFPEKSTKNLPLEGTKSQGGALKPFYSKKIFQWLVDNASDKVNVWCRRNYGMSNFGDHDDFQMIVFFALESDLLAFKLWWH